MSEENLADIALIGLAVMGQNLVLNMDDHGFKVCVYNRTVEKVKEFLNNEAKGTNVVGSVSLEDMVSKLKTPRRVMMLVKAGKPVDDFIDKLVPLLQPGDIIIDGGNSEYTDSLRREKSLREKGLYFVGSGVSGGEEGARRGPSLMPGGSPEAWPFIKDIFQSIAAKVDDQPCCDWVGSGGSGHFVKMVHNGIEYGDMQLICEAYQLLKSILRLSNDEMAKVFDEWNKEELDSFLIEIARDIFAFKNQDGVSELDNIYDSAGQKGTGKWTVNSSIDYKIPLTLIGEAVQARCLSALKQERVEASKKLEGPKDFPKSSSEFIDQVKKALYASKIISYAQGFMLMREVSEKLKWNLNFGAIALMWRGGCIIRSKFLGAIKVAYDKQPTLSNLLLDDFFKQAMNSCYASWKNVVEVAVKAGIPAPAFSSALSFFNGFKSKWIPSDSFQIYKGISADDKPYVPLVGSGDAGDFVEKVFRGVESTNWQLLFEAAHLVKSALQVSDDELAELCKDWNEGDLESSTTEKFLEVLSRSKAAKEELKTNPGEWAMACSLDYGMPLTVLSESVHAGYLSNLKSERCRASEEFKDLERNYAKEGRELVEKIKKALISSEIVSYAQGFMLVREVSEKLKLNLNFGEVALEQFKVSKSKILSHVCEAFEADEKLTNILWDECLKSTVGANQDLWRYVVSLALEKDVPIPALSASLSFYDGYRTERLPANLLQALRDYFGAHTYSLLNAPSVFIHTDWTGRGGRVTATTYNS